MSIKNIVDRIRNEVDIVLYIGKYVSLKPRGKKYWGLSPFKNEKTPSFCVDAERKFYYCFSTNQGGDIFNFVEKMEQMSFIDAVRVLAREIGVDIDKERASAPYDQESMRVLELCARIAKTFVYLFHTQDADSARDYLSQRHINAQTIEEFQLGYSPDSPKWLYNFLKSKNYTEEEIQESGLFSKNYPGYTLFRNRIMFPIHTISGQIVGYGGRQIPDTQPASPDKRDPKYINSPETKYYKKKRMLYGLHQCVRKNGFSNLKKTYLVEGYLDVLALHQVGMHSALAPLGTAFTLEQAEIIRKHCDTLVLLFDKDEAGMNAALQSAMIAEQLSFKSIKLVILSENDPAEILEKYGEDELRTQLNNEVDFFEYYIAHTVPSSDVSSQEKERSLDDILFYISHIASEFQKAEYIRIIAERYNLDIQLVKNQMQRQLKKTQVQGVNYEQGMYQSDPSKKAKGKIQHNGEMLAMVSLCSILSKECEYYASFRSNVKYEDLDDLHAREIYAILEELYRSGSINLHEVFQSLSAELVNYMQNLIASGEASENAREIINQFYKTTHIKRIKKRSKEIEHELRVLTSTTHNASNSDEGIALSIEIENKSKIKDLLREKKFINDELMRVQKEY